MHLQVLAWMLVGMTEFHLEETQCLESCRGSGVSMRSSVALEK